MKEDEFTQFCQSNEGLDVLSELNYKGVPQRANIDWKEKVLRCMIFPCQKRKALFLERLLISFLYLCPATRITISFVFVA